jgi:hypothetical protein
MKFGGMRPIPFHHILIIVKLNGLVGWNFWPGGIIGLVD